MKPTPEDIERWTEIATDDDPDPDDLAELCEGFLAARQALDDGAKAWSAERGALLDGIARAGMLAHEAREGAHAAAVARTTVAPWCVCLGTCIASAGAIAFGFLVGRDNPDGTEDEFIRYARGY